MAVTDDAANVAIKPPFLFLGALALGCLLSLILPIPPGLAQPNTLALMVGLTFVAIGFLLAALSVRHFQLAGTSVVPGEPSTALVVKGPYAFTRNPIYSASRWPISAWPSCLRACGCCFCRSRSW